MSLCEIDRFWQNYLSSLDPDPKICKSEYFVWSFGDTVEEASTLGQLVKAGKKTVTCSLFWSYENEGAALPEPTQISIVTDSQSKPLCIIQTTKVEIINFNAINAQFAFAEGEGDGSLDYWRQVHWDFFSKECVGLGRQPSIDMPLVCEYFKLVFNP